MCIAHPICSFSNDFTSMRPSQSAVESDFSCQLILLQTCNYEFLYTCLELCYLIQVSSKDEDFLDLSVDVENNTSITHCLRGFSSTETLRSEHKYYCEVCCSKQEAQKRYIQLLSPLITAVNLLMNAA